MSATKCQGESSHTIGSPWFTLSTASISDLSSLQSKKMKQRVESKTASPKKGKRSMSTVSSKDNIPQSSLSKKEQEAREREIALIRKLDGDTRTEIVSLIRKLDGDTRREIQIQQKESTSPDTTKTGTANDNKRNPVPISTMTSTETNVRKMIEAFERKLASHQTFLDDDLSIPVGAEDSSGQDALFAKSAKDPEEGDSAEQNTTKDENEQKILPTDEIANREIPNSSGRESAASSVISKDSTTVSYESASDDSDSRDRYSEPTFWAPGTTEVPNYDYGSDRESTSYVTDTEPTMVSFESDKDESADDYSEPTFWIESKHGNKVADFGNKIIPREVVVQEEEKESPKQDEPKTRKSTQGENKPKKGNSVPAKRKRASPKPRNGKKEKKSKTKSKSKTKKKKKARSKYKKKGNGKSRKSKKVTLKVQSFPDADPVTNQRKARSTVEKRPRASSGKRRVSFKRDPVSPTEPTSPSTVRSSSTVRSNPFLQWDIESGLVYDGATESVSRSCMDDLAILSCSKVTDGSRRNAKVIRRRIIGIGVVLFLIAFSLILFVLLDPLKRWSNYT